MPHGPALVYIQFYAGIGDGKRTEEGGKRTEDGGKRTEQGGVLVLLLFGISGAHFTQMVRLTEKAFENERRLMREVCECSSCIICDLMFQRVQVEREAFLRATDLADRRSSDHWRQTERVS